MRDAIKNYRLIIKGKMADSDSETECQPLVSSTSSSSLAKSFGATLDSGIFKTESESGHDNNKEPPRNVISFQGPTKPLDYRKYLAKRMLFPSSYDSPGLNIFTNNQIVYDSYQNYSKISGTIFDEESLIQLPQKGFTKNYKDLDEEKMPTNNSLVTIFAIWNTTMGSSLLAMSWGLEKSGLFPGILISLFVAAISLYTAYVIIKVNEKHGIVGQTKEMPDLCRLLIGRWAEILAKIFSLIVLTGANIVYWILMSNFLYNSVRVLYGYVYLRGSEPSLATDPSAVLCPNDLMKPNVTVLTDLNDTVVATEITAFDQAWDLYRTVPIFLAVLMFPLLNFKSPTFFTKFNSLGTISVLYIMSFVTAKASIWGINIPSWSFELDIKATFCALSGMLSLSYFIHNIIISLVKNNKYQENNGRDLTVAFGLVTFTYLFMGIVFYVSFPLAKSCIQDNILNNFDKYDTMTVIARLLLLFQLFTVFPLICFMLRNDILTNINSFFKNYTFGNFTYCRVIALNGGVLTICILFACFLPRIGTLIRYTGALSGLVYIYMLPSLLKIASLKKERRLTTFKLLFHMTIVLLGVLNLFSQFFITD